MCVAARELRGECVSSRVTGTGAFFGGRLRTDRLAMGFVAAACLCILLPALGWLLGIDGLTTFGAHASPVWPWTLLGFAGLTAAVIATMRGDFRRARLLAAIPIAIAIVAGLELVAGGSLPSDGWLLPERIVRSTLEPGRPRGAGALILLALAGSVMAASWPRRLADELSILLASATLAFSLATAMIVLLLAGDEVERSLFVNSLPSSLAGVTISSALLTWRSSSGWPETFSGWSIQGKFARIMLPAILVLAVVPTIVAVWLLDQVHVSPFELALLVIGGNVAIVAAVVVWGAQRVASQRSELHELATALDAATVALIQPDGIITHWSNGCRQLYGWTREEALGRNKYELLRSRCERLGVDGPPPRAPEGEQELVEVCRDGTEVGVIERIHPVEVPGRGPVLVLKILDISERLRAAAALNETQERLAVAIEAYQVGVFEWDVATGKLHWSPGTEQRLGLIPGVIHDFESWKAAIEPEDFDRIVATIAETVAKRAPKFNFRYRFVTPLSGVRAVEGSSRAFYDTQGNLMRTVGVILDVTESHEREAVLRAREAQLQSVLETVPDAMVAVDGNGIIRQFSIAAETLWGHRAVDVTGRHFTLLVPEELRERYANAIINYLARGEGGFLTEVVLGTGEAADGRTFPVEIRTGLARLDDHALFTIFFRDISERLATEERLGRMNAELAHVGRQSAMSELAADIAHELNQPLSATVNFLAGARMLLERDEEKERALDMLRMGSEQTMRAGQIIRRMRDFTERRDIEVTREPVADAVRDAAELVLVGTGQFHIRLSYDLDPDASHVMADRIQLQQVLVNLLRNSVDALRSSPPGNRQITIGSRPIDGKFIEIEVRDAGPGIPDSVLESAFSRFTSTKGKGGGMGIGLSISKRIIEAHGGTLSAENRAEGGAIFRFTLPAVGEDVEE